MYMPSAKEPRHTSIITEKLLEKKGVTVLIIFQEGQI